MQKVFLNNKIVDSQDAAVPVTDGGFLYGAGLFETMRAASGNVFAIEDHLERLFASADALAMKISYDTEFLKQSVVDVLGANDLFDARIRLTMTFTNHQASTLLITAQPYEPQPAEYYQNGVRIVTSKYQQSPTDGHKTTSYMRRINDLQEARENGAFESIWLTADGRVAEGCVSNLFMVKDGVVLTPPCETPVLPGIARKTVIALCRNLGIAVEEKSLTLSQCRQADEVFLSNVMIQIMPVTKFDDEKIADGHVGPITKQLMSAFDRHLKTQCGVKS